MTKSQDGRIRDAARELASHIADIEVSSALSIKIATAVLEAADREVPLWPSQGSLEALEAAWEWFTSL